MALVGESGSGKSTVARLLAGQERLTSGAIRLDGQPVDLSTRRAFRRHKSEVQLVFQDPFASLNPVHTVRYHLERPVRLHQGRRSRAEVAREVAALLEQVRLIPADQFTGKYPHELSGGQRQRVSFARALAAEPSVLLADEPVSMLDVSIRLEMLSLLDDLRQRFRLALLYITHDIASARYFADEVLVMYAGQIVERGPAEELTQQPAHPYTQLLVASAPDPDNLGGGLRSCHPATSPPSGGTARPPANGAARRRRHRHIPASSRKPCGPRLPVQPQVPVRRRPLPRGEPGTAAGRPGPRRRLLAPGHRRASGTGRRTKRWGMRTDAEFGLSAQQQQEESMRRLLRRRSLAGIAAVAVICGGVAACSSSSSTATGTAATPRRPRRRP